MATTIVNSTVVPLGIPRIDLDELRGWQGGKVYYVCSAGGVDGAQGSGETQGAPLLSLFGTSAKGYADGALFALRGRVNKGDVIYILPGHTETVGAADAAVATGAAAGFSIVGLGTGDTRPTFNWTTAASTWLLDTAGVEIANCILNFAVTAATVVVTPITVSAKNCRITNCFINWGVSTTIGCGSTLGAIAVTTAGDNFEFRNNFCLNLDVAGTSGNAITLLSLNGADYCTIDNNRIFGATTATTVGPVHFLTTLSSNVTISNNYIENLIASSTIAVSSAIAGVTGQVSNNRFRVNSGIQPVTVSSNMSTTLFNNYAADTVNQNGALVVGAGTST